MGDHVAVMEPQYAGLTTMRSELDKSKKVAIMMAKLKEHSEYEPLITFISVIKKKETT